MFKRFTTQGWLCTAGVICLLVCGLNALIPSVSAAEEDSEQSFTERHRELVSNNPEDVEFTIQLAGGAKTVRQGEAIVIEQLFSSSTADRYQLSVREYDRSGRLHSDSYFTDPEVVDPLRDYYSSALGSFFIAGGLTSPPPMLGSTPEGVALSVNDYVRFDRPGVYRLYMVSTRVDDMTVQTDNRAISRCKLTSNILEFEVLPRAKRAPAWYKTATNEQLQRYGTKEAVDELFSRLNSERLILRSLFASPHRDYVIREMEKILTAPDWPIDAQFLQTLTNMKAATEYRSSNHGGEEEWKERRRAGCQVNVETLTELHRVLGRKKEDVRARCLEALEREVWRILRRHAEVELPPWAVEIQDEFVRNFMSLSPREQFSNLWIEYLWRPNAGPAMLPHLRTLYEHPPEFEHADSDAEESLAGVALKRLYELAPEEGRECILREIASPKPRARIVTLGVLPDEKLPELERRIIENLEAAIAEDKSSQDTETLARLIQRYGSAESLLHVTRIYEESAEGMGEGARAALLEYLLEFDPDYGG